MQSFENILLYSDPATDDSARVLAVELARENKARLTLMNVVKPLPAMLGMTCAVDTMNELQHVIVSDQRRQLLDLASEYSHTGVSLDVVVAVGAPGDETARQVILGKHDLLIKTAEGVVLFDREVERFSQSLLRLCPCPVWLLKRDFRGPFNRVLAAIDASSDTRANRLLNQRILEHASHIAQCESAALHVVSVPNIGMANPVRIRMRGEEVDTMATEHKFQLREYLDDLMSDINLPIPDVCRQVICGDTIRNVVDQVNADLVVMGLPWHTGISELLIGDTAGSVLNDAKCSVLAIKPEGFVSPVHDKPQRAGIRWDAVSEYSFRT